MVKKGEGTQDNAKGKAASGSSSSSGGGRGGGKRKAKAPPEPSSPPPSSLDVGAAAASSSGKGRSSSRKKRAKSSGKSPNQQANFKAEDDTKPAAVPTSTSRLLHVLPQAIFSHICTFLMDDDVGNFARCNKACLAFYHCMPSVSFFVTGHRQEEEAMESLRARLDGPGILHLKSVIFAIDEHEDHGDITTYAAGFMPSYLSTLHRVFTAAAASKLPELSILDIHPFILSSPEELRGLSALRSLKELVLPVISTPPAPTGDSTTTTTNTTFRLDDELNALTNLETLHLGFSDGRDLVPLISSPSGVVPAWASRIKVLNLSGVLLFSEADFMEAVTHIRRYFPRLEQLLWFNQEEKHDPSLDKAFKMGPLAAAFRDGALPHLRVLDLSDQPLNNSGVSKLMKAMAVGASKHPDKTLPLHTLRLRCVKLGDDPLGDITDDEEERGQSGPYYAVKELAQGLEKGILPHLRCLSLANNFLGVDGGRALAHAFRIGTWEHLEELDLGLSRDALTYSERKEASFGPGMATTLMSSMVRLTNLRKLNLGGHQLGGEAIIHLTNHLDSLSKLEYLNMDGCHIDDHAADLLASFLRQGGYPCLHELSLADNYITGADMDQRDPLPPNTKISLVCVSLARNNLDRESLTKIFAAFITSKVRRLSLSKVRTFAGCKNTATLGQCLSQYAPNLEELDLTGCGRECYLDTKALLSNITTPIHLSTIDLAGNHLGLASLKAFVDGSNCLPNLMDVRVDCHGTVLLKTLSNLLRALKRGQLKSLLRFQIDCRHAMEISQENKQLQLAQACQRVRPWLQLHVTWPGEGENHPDLSDSDSSSSDDDDDDDDDEDGYFLDEFDDYSSDDDDDVHWDDDYADEDDDEYDDEESFVDDDYEDEEGDHVFVWQEGNEEGDDEGGANGEDGNGDAEEEEEGGDDDSYGGFGWAAWG